MDDNDLGEFEFCKPVDINADIKKENKRTVELEVKEKIMSNFIRQYYNTIYDIPIMNEVDAMPFFILEIWDGYTNCKGLYPPEFKNTQNNIYTSVIRKHRDIFCGIYISLEQLSNIECVSLVLSYYNDSNNKCCIDIYRDDLLRQYQEKIENNEFPMITFFKYDEQLPIIALQYISISIDIKVGELGISELNKNMLVYQYMGLPYKNDDRYKDVTPENINDKFGSDEYTIRRIFARDRYIDHKYTIDGRLLTISNGMCDIKDIP